MNTRIHSVESLEQLGALADACRPPDIHLVDLGDLLVEGADTQLLVQLHAGWRQQGSQVHYVASRPITRGSCIVAAHSAGDGDCHVAPTRFGAQVAIDRGLGRTRTELNRFVGNQIEPRFGGPSETLRWMVKPMDWMGRLQQGYSVPFVANILSTFGIAGLTTLFPLLMEAEERVNEHYGQRVGHLVTAFLTQGNGCAFCMYGHLYAANLLLFEESGELGPISESETPQLHRLRDSEAAEVLGSRLVGTALEAAESALQKILRLRSGGAVEDEQDELLLRGQQAWALINECSLQAPLEVAPPFDSRLARNRRLQRAYREARSAA